MTADFSIADRLNRPTVDPRDPQCPEDDEEGDEEGDHTLTRNVDIDIIDGQTTLVITAKCSCGWVDVLEVPE